MSNTCTPCIMADIVAVNGMTALDAAMEAGVVACVVALSFVEAATL